MPQNLLSKEDQINKNIPSRHIQNSAMLIILYYVLSAVLRTVQIVVRQQSIGS